MSRPHIIVTGNPVDGLQFIGPFPSNEDACFFGNTDAHLPQEWWVAPLYPPVDANIEQAHHPKCPAIDGFGCRCEELE